jgi:DnaJ like chaperone protein
MAATHLIMPPWTGKALGAAAALAFAPHGPPALVWWLAGGVALGHLLDTLGMRLADGTAQAPTRRHRQTHDRASLRFTFAALGRIAAASGGVGPEHRRHTELLMARLAFTPERRQEALLWFQAGRDDAFPFDTLGAACRLELAEHPVLEDLAIQSLCRMAALVDTPGATAELLALGDRVGWDRELVTRQALAIAAAMPDRDPLELAREILGVRPGDSPELVRLAYRRRVARWHPNRLPGEAGAEERRAAELKMSQLSDALDTLLAVGPG